MSSLETPPNPAPPTPPAKLRTGRYGEMEEHELIRLLDTIDDERSRARFRESIYLSIFIWIVVAWFAINYRVILHQPRLVNPVDALKQREMALLNERPNLTRALPRKPSAPTPTIDAKTLERLRAAARAPAPPPPPPPTPPQPTPLPPVATPPPTPPQPRQPIPDAPAPSPKLLGIQPQSAGNAIRSAAEAAARGGGGIPSIPNHPSRHPNVGAGVEILSDTQNVDFNDYLRRLHDIIQNSWDPLLPESTRPPISVKGITGIRFKILPNGQIDGPPILETRSGEHALDVAAWGAITSGGFPALPKEFHGPNLELRCGFYVNEPLPNN